MPSPEAVPPPLPLSSDIALVLLSLGCAIFGVTEVTRKPDTGQGERGLGVIEPQVPSTSRMALEVKFLTCNTRPFDFTNGFFQHYNLLSRKTSPRIPALKAPLCFEEGWGEEVVSEPTIITWSFRV